MNMSLPRTVKRPRGDTMKLNKVVDGKHNQQNFAYRNGKLTMFNHTWDKADIKTLVETANLLAVEGYELKMPIRIEREQRQDFLGNVYDADIKVYEEDGD